MLQLNPFISHEEKKARKSKELSLWIHHETVSTNGHFYLQLWQNST